MLGLYVPSVAGALAFAVCFYGWAAFELWVNLKAGRQGSTNRDRFSRYLIIGGMLVGFMSAVSAANWLPGADILFFREQVFYAGLVLMLVGLALRWVAIRQLGRYFLPEVIIQPGHRVFDGGLYRYLRHPSYTGTLITVVGYGLALTNWASLLIMLIVYFIIYLVRIQIEEAALQEALGDEYRIYMRRTHRIIPFIL